MKGSKILLKGDLERMIEGVISGTPKPGTIMQLQASTAEVGGRLTYEVYNPSAVTDPRQVLVLLEDSLQGKLYSDAYVSGTRGFLYPVRAGDELNMLTKDVSGTGDTHTIGDRLAGDPGTGKLVVVGTSANRAQFQAIETVAAPTADIWLACIAT